MSGGNENMDDAGQALIAAVGEYIKMTKNRLLAEAFDDQEGLLQSATGLERGTLFYALCSYFCMRTEYELEMREFQDDWIEVIWDRMLHWLLADANLDSDIYNRSRAEIVKKMRYARKQMNHAIAVGRTPDDSKVVAPILRTLARVEEASRLSDASVARMLHRWEPSRNFLDEIARVSK